MSSTSSVRKLTYWAVACGVVLCLFAAIWDVRPVKWILSAFYLILVFRYFGLTYRKEEVKGTYLKSPYKPLNFYNYPRKK